MLRGKPRWHVRRSYLPSLTRLGVVPADDRLGKEAASAERRRGERLAAALRGAGEDWDVVVVDMPPGLGGLAASALWAADAVVIPAAADYLSIHALQGTIESVRSIERDTGHRYARWSCCRHGSRPPPGGRGCRGAGAQAVSACWCAHRDPAQLAVRLVCPGGGSGRGGRAALDGRSRQPPCGRRPRRPSRAEGRQAPRSMEGVRARRHARCVRNDAERAPSTDGRRLVTANERRLIHVDAGWVLDGWWSQPLASAMPSASARLRAPSFRIAALR